MRNADSPCPVRRVMCMKRKCEELIKKQNLLPAIFAPQAKRSRISAVQRIYAGRHLMENEGE